MNTLTQKLVSSLATGLLLVALAPTSAFTQTIGAPSTAIRKLAPETTTRPDLARIIKRPAREFKPFEMRDPKTGKAIPPGSEVALPNGKKTTAQQYFDQLNHFEKKFNEMGYSLRDPGNKTRIQETSINKPALQQQVNVISARQKSTQPAPLSLQDVQKDVAEQTRTSAQRLQILQGPLAKFIKTPTVHTEKAWNYSVGDPSVLSAYFKAKLVLHGTKDVTSVNAEADAGGSVLGYTQSLLRLMANLNAPKTGTMNAKVDAYVLGTSVYNLNQNLNASWSKSDSVSKPYDYSKTFRFWLGPIPVSVKVGAQGAGGVTYFAGIHPLSATAWIVPKVNSKVYAQAGVDIVVAGAGVRGNMTLLNYELLLVGQCSIKIDSAGKPYFFEQFFAREDINCLTGDLELYAYIYVPCWGVPPYCKKEYTWDFWPWEGFKSNTCLFSDTKKTYLPIG